MDLSALREVMMEVCDLMDRPDADTGWSRHTIDDARLVCHEHLRRIENGDLSRVRDLELLFAPTGLLQEASMASGWADRYLALSRRFDAIVERSGARANRRPSADLSDPGEWCLGTTVQEQPDRYFVVCQPQVTRTAGSENFL